jgi:hypothetical protein
VVEPRRPGRAGDDKARARRGGEDPDASVEAMVLERRLRRVEPNHRFQQELLRRSGESLFAARKVLEDAPSTAFVNAYDSIRHAVDAHLNRNGLRVESGEGGHRHRVAYARLQMIGLLSEDDLDYYRAAREIRNRTEYPEPNQPATVNLATARQAVDVAKRIYAAVKKGLPPPGELHGGRA